MHNRGGRVTRCIRKHLRDFPRHRFQVPWLESVSITVSNNINEEELARLAQEVGQGRAGAGAGQRGAKMALGLQTLSSVPPSLTSSRAVRSTSLALAPTWSPVPASLPWAVFIR